MGAVTIAVGEGRKTVFLADVTCQLKDDLCGAGRGGSQVVETCCSIDRREGSTNGAVGIGKGDGPGPNTEKSEDLVADGSGMERNVCVAGIDSDAGVKGGVSHARGRLFVAAVSLDDGEVTGTDSGGFSALHDGNPVLLGKVMAQYAASAAPGPAGVAEGMTVCGGGGVSRQGVAG